MEQDHGLAQFFNNEMYTGVMVQGRTKKVSYKSKTLITMPREQWFRVEVPTRLLLTARPFKRYRS